MQIPKGLSVCSIIFCKFIDYMNNLTTLDTSSVIWQQWKILVSCLHHSVLKDENDENVSHCKSLKKQQMETEKFIFPSIKFWIIYLFYIVCGIIEIISFKKKRMLKNELKNQQHSCWSLKMFTPLFVKKCNLKKKKKERFF